MPFSSVAVSDPTAVTTVRPCGKPAGPPMFSLEGNLVIVDHGMGLNSAFLHLSSVAVHEGQRVRQGDPIGTVGIPLSWPFN